MGDSRQVYNGYLIWRDAFRWVVRTEAGGQVRFGTLKAARAYVDRNPRPLEKGVALDNH